MGSGPCTKKDRVSPEIDPVSQTEHSDQVFKRTINYAPIHRCMSLGNN